MSYQIPGVTYSDSGFVHERSLGYQVNGSYPDVTWSDVMINGIPLDTTLNLEHQDYLIDMSQEVARMQEEILPEGIINQIDGCQISMKKMNVFEKGAKPCKIKGDKDLHDAYKRRYMSNHKKKKYPTKPKVFRKIHSNKYDKYL